MANWMVLGFTIVAGTVITTAASLLKRFGLRKIMLCGYVLSLAGGLLGLFSWDFWSMLAARLVQALTVGLFFPVDLERHHHRGPPGQNRHAALA